jgi:nucleoside-diphosphate-sugar epimerase
VKVLVTGATGFVGQALIAGLLEDGHHVLALMRRVTNTLPVGVEQLITRDCADWAEPESRADAESRQSIAQLKRHLQDVDVIVHAAARAHVLNRSESNALDEFSRVNTDATLYLAHLAAEAGVKRFIYISTIGVNGSVTNNRPFTERDVPAPHNAYAMSKWAAEQGLTKVANEAPMEVVIIRPPLVYGLDAPGNFRTLLAWVKRGVPLPLGRTDNRRAFIARTNLVDFILLAMIHPKAANETFLISDGEDVSTTHLLESVAAALKVPSRLFFLPRGLMSFFARLFGRRAMFEQLWGSLEIDSSKARRLLGWQPLVTILEELDKSTKLQ